ncbi:putative dehydrogenase [Cellulomonas soli]|nr:putative dehydrogenase [Cellulomonas soli]
MGMIKIGVLGGGPIAAVFAERLGELDGVRLGAIGPAAGEDVTALADRYGVPVAADAHALAADATLDAVYVVSVSSQHAEHAVALLSAGKHVLVEKPMACTAAQVAAMTAAARAHDRLLMELYPAPFEPNIAALREAVPRLDRVRRAVLVKDQYSSAFDAYRAGQNPPAFDPTFGGGSILDLGFYPVSLAVHLFGAPQSVTATGRLLDNGADSQGLIVLGYPDLEVDCLHSKVSSSGIDSQVAGEQSALLLDDISTPSRVHLLERGPSRRLEPVADLSRARTGSHLVYGIDAFVDLVREGARDSAIHPLADVVTAHQVLDEARRQVGVRFPADD